MTRESFGKGMARFMAVSRIKLSDGEQEIYFGELNHLCDSDFINSIRYICQNVKDIYPTTNIVALIIQTAESLLPTCISPVEAWEEVLKASLDIRKRGSINEASKRALSLEGIEWHTITPGGGFELAPDKVGYIRRSFMAAYKELSQSKNNGAQSGIEDIWPKEISHRGTTNGFSKI